MESVSPVQLSKEERRKRAKKMMDEDYDSLVEEVHHRRVKKVKSGSSSGRSAASEVNSSPSTPSTSPTRATSTTSSPKLAIHFAGKVYRTLDQSQGVSYSPEANFLGEPDEEVGEALRESREKRRLDMERDMLREAVRVTKRLKTLDSDGEDDFLAPRAGPSKLAESAKITPSKCVPPRRAASPGPSLRTLETNSARSSPPPPPFPSIFATKLPPGFSPLPAPLANLFTLHTTLETTLLFHLANSGSAIASSACRTNDDGEATIRMPNLIDLHELSRNIASGGRRFGEKELANLVWVWQGCGARDGDTVKVEDDDDLTFDFNSQEAGGMGFLVTKSKAGTATSIVWTYGIGISVAVKANPQLPKLELADPSQPKQSPKSPSSVGRGRDGMSVVALWSQGKEARKEEFGRRLRAWAKRCAQDEAGSALAAEGRQFPSNLPQIPRATLPSLAHAIPCVPGTTSPSPKRKAPVDVFGPAISVPSASSADTKASLVTSLMAGTKAQLPNKQVKSASQRRREMMERIRKKAEPPEGFIARAGLLLGSSPANKSLRPDKDTAVAWRQEQAERLKRRSMLSRLGDVADGVWMLFDVGRRSSVLLDEVSDSIAKSSKISLSLDEAQNSLRLLCELCPLFVYIKTVSLDEWLFMKGEIGLQDVKRRVAQELDATA